MDARRKRLADNESAFRQINERIEELANRHGADSHLYEFLCECSNADCTLRLEMTIEEYEHVRADGTRFALAPGHHLPEIETVVSRGKRYWVIEKQGEAGERVEEDDPRA